MTVWLTFGGAVHGLSTNQGMHSQTALQESVQLGRKLDIGWRRDCRVLSSVCVGGGGGAQTFQLPSQKILWNGLFLKG